MCRKRNACAAHIVIRVTVFCTFFTFLPFFVCSNCGLCTRTVRDIPTWAILGIWFTSHPKILSKYRVGGKLVSSYYITIIEIGLL